MSSLLEKQKHCVICEKIILKPLHSGSRDWKKRKFCSYKCLWIHNKSNPNKGTFKIGQISPFKGKEGLKGSSNGHWKGGQLEKVCLICSKEYLVDKYRENSRTCSLTCEQLYRKTEEFRTHLSEIQRSKIDVKLQALTQTVNQFRDILRSCSKYKMWRERVMKRDNFTCQMCEIRGGKLCIDHIKPFIVILFENKIESYEDAIKCKEMWDIQNGQTLCYPCHAKTPTYGSQVWKTLSTNL